IMTFTALTGSVSHFLIEGAQPDWLVFGLCVGFTFIWAQIAAIIANKVKAKTLNRLLGAILVALGTVIVVFSFIPK
ncbi:MAG: sulfite exporter TauE/SafE family protein, partial [Clostridia bacterium]|nr:sulfite exporter TauE/SafE family protein [Clostridia bacterium]